jgi:hypothetical protein
VVLTSDVGSGVGLPYAARCSDARAVVAGTSTGWTQMHGNRWLVVALVVLAVVTSWQSVQAERSTTYGLTRVLYRASGDMLADLARDGSNQMRDRFAFSLELRPYVEGGTVVVPGGQRTLATTTVRGLAGAELLVRDYDPLIDPELAHRLRDEARLTGSLPSRDGAREAVGPSASAPVHVVLVDAGGTVYVVAVDQLTRAAVDVPGLDLGALSAEDLLDG